MLKQANTDIWQIIIRCTATAFYASACIVNRQVLNSFGEALRPLLQSPVMNKPRLKPVIGRYLQG